MHKPSTRRKRVAARRIQSRVDVLRRRPKRYRYPKRRPVLILEGFTPDDAIALIDRLLADETKQ